MGLSFREFDAVITALNDYAFLLERRHKRGEGNQYTEELAQTVRNAREKIIRSQITVWEMQVKEEKERGE